MQPALREEALIASEMAQPHERGSPCWGTHIGVVCWLVLMVGFGLTEKEIAF